MLAIGSYRQNQWMTVALFLFVVLGVVFFPSAGRDDDYIAFWGANSLLEFGELVNYNGERVEQGSSLGHIFVLAIASGISRLPIPDLAVPVSVAAGIMVLFLLTRFKSFFDRRAVNYALLLTATSFSFVYWSFSGLETSIYTLALTFFSFLILKITQNITTNREYSYLFVVILVLQLLRPEAFFVLGLLIGLFWLFRTAREINNDDRTSTLIATVIHLEITRFASIAILIDFVVFAVIAAFRYVYFDSIFPQPVISKVSGIFPGLHAGMPIEPGGRYIAEFFAQNLVFSGAILATLGVALRIVNKGEKDGDASADILIAIILSQFTFILLAGPDWMEAFRFIVPVIPILSLSAAFFFAGLSEKNLNFERLLIAILICLQAIGFGFFVGNRSSSVPLWATRNNVVQAIAGAENYSWFARANTHHLRDIPVTQALIETIRELRSVVGDRPIVIMSFQAGFVIYHVAKEHFGQIRFIDLASLADDTITKCSPLRSEVRRIRDEAAREHRLGHLEVSRYMILESDQAGTCFSPRPDVIYMLGGGVESSPQFQKLGYELAFTNTGDISLDFGIQNFYGGYLIDSDLFASAGLKFERSHVFVSY